MNFQTLWSIIMLLWALFCIGLLVDAFLFMPRRINRKYELQKKKLDEEFKAWLLELRDAAAQRQKYQSENEDNKEVTIH